MFSSARLAVRRWHVLSVLLAVLVSFVVLPATASVAEAATHPLLRQGSRGAAVKSLQHTLAALHYDVGSADGIFGSQTLHGVVAFQKVNRLGRDGIVGPKTWRALAHPVQPKLKHHRSGTTVEVDLSKQVVYLAHSGSVRRIYDASSGKASTATPRGKFHVTRRINAWRHSHLGLLWRPNYFYRGYALHGSKSVPNHPASHGCVRLTIESMNRLWPQLRVGVPVYVYA